MEFTLKCQAENIIHNRIVVNDNFIHYENKLFWLPRPDEAPIDGFKRAYPLHFNKVFKRVYAELSLLNEIMNA